MTDTFTCAMCKETFGKLRSDEDAEKESKMRFGDLPKEDTEIVCDPCFQKAYKEYIIDKIKRLVG